MLNHKNEQNGAIAATWTQPDIIILSKVNQKEKHKHHKTYIWNLNYDTNEPIQKTDTDKNMG